MVRSFKEFLTETKKFGQLKHLEHLEDHPINDGEAGFHAATNALEQAHNHITTGHSDSTLTTKYDGSPSIVFGHHPKTGKFFVATKSAFNKDPKLNHSEEEIDKNYGDQPGLAEKLKQADRHLQKVAPKKGIYQGDLMYGEGDVKHEKGMHHFTPNTITYSAEDGTEQGNKIAKSKLGVVVHTKYHGTNFETMNAGFNPDTHNFKKHPDVNMIDPNIDTSKINHTPANEKKFQNHLAAAKKEFSKAHYETFPATASHKEHLKRYINSTVDTGEKPSVEGYKAHLTKRFHNDMSKLKSAKGKTGVQAKLDEHLHHLEEHKKHFSSLFKMHHHLQEAKNALVSSLSSNPHFHHSVNGEHTDPEGFVITHQGQPTKLVNRAGFSRLNRSKVRNK